MVGTSNESVPESWPLIMPPLHQFLIPFPQEAEQSSEEALAEAAAVDARGVALLRDGDSAT